MTASPRRSESAVRGRILVSVENRQQRPPTPAPALQALAIFVGRWSTTGDVKDAAGLVVAQLRAVDTYEWLPGGFFLLHRWDARIGDDESQGIEIIGYDTQRQTYSTHSFDSQGNRLTYQATLQDKVWKVWSKSERFVGRFSGDTKTLTGAWERCSDSSTWVRWMDVKLCKSEE